MTMSVPCYLYSYLYGLPMTTQRKEKLTYFTLQRKEPLALNVYNLYSCHFVNVDV